MASLRSKLEEQVTCSVCLEQLQDPKVLPCLHSYCHNCLLGLVKSGKITCPDCRAEIEVGDLPGACISSLPSNFFINNLLATMSEDFDEGDAAAKGHSCENCENGCSVEYRCIKCELSLCRLCSESHTLSEATKYHSLLALSELDAVATTKDVETSGCSKHNNEMLSIFCVACEEAICKICAKETHQDHEQSPAENIADNKEKEEIENILEKLRGGRSRLSENLTDVSESQERLTTRGDSVVAEITNYFETLGKVLEKRKSELVDQAVSLINARKTKLEGPREHFELLLTRCDNIINGTEKMFASGKDAELSNQKSALVECLNALKNVFEQEKPTAGISMEFVANCSAKEIDEKILKHSKILSDVASPERSVASFKESKSSLALGKESVVNLICKDESNQEMKTGGQLITPIFTGVKVRDVSVHDNNNGSYDTMFTVTEVGTLKFQALINGHPSPGCTLSKKVNWALRDNIGNGTLSADGLTLTGDSVFGSWCYRVGDCSFETGIHTWKVDTHYSGGHSRFSFKKEIELGVVDCDGDLSHNGLKSGHTRKWVGKCSAGVIVVVKLDMIQHVLSVQCTGGSDEMDRSIPPVHYTFNITTNRVSPFLALRGRHLSSSIIHV